jgi:hypothetical protein
MKNALNQIRRSKSEIRFILKEKEKSEISVKEFCKIHKIHKSTFYTWRNKYGLEIQSPEKFIPVKLNDIASEATLFAEIELPSKRVLRLFHKVESSYIKALL